MPEKEMVHRWTYTGTDTADRERERESEKVHRWTETRTERQRRSTDTGTETVDRETEKFRNGLMLALSS